MRPKTNKKTKNHIMFNVGVAMIGLSIRFDDDYDGDGDNNDDDVADGGNLHAICASQLPNPNLKCVFTSKIYHFT